MRRSYQLFPRVLDRLNLRRAAVRAARGKRQRPEARQFFQHLDDHLHRIATQLRAGTYAFGRSHQFLIFDPKQRLITAPVFEERVIHHALIQVCEPRFDSWLIDDTFACRSGRGRLVAIARAQHFSRRFSHFLKLDIRKYFDSISHTILRERLRRMFGDRQLLAVFDQIIHAYLSRPDTTSNGGVSDLHGLPIGSLTSQHFANFYLGWFDRHVKEHWRVPGYVRYMDDMLLWANNARDLNQLLRQSRAWLESELDLQLKPEPYINRTCHGVEFLSVRIHPTHLTLARKARVRAARKWRFLQRELLAGRLSEADFQRRATALFAFLSAGGVSSRRFRTTLLNASRCQGELQGDPASLDEECPDHSSSLNAGP